MQPIPRWSKEKLQLLVSERAANKIAELAERIGTPRGTVYGWLRGTQKPDPDQLMALSRVLFADFDEFYVQPGEEN